MPPKPKPPAEILSLAEGLEREWDRSLRSLDQAQHSVELAEARAFEAADLAAIRSRAAQGDEPAEDGAGLPDGDGERSVPGLERARLEADRALETALGRVESATEERMHADAEQRLAEQLEELESETDRQVRVTAARVRAETASDYKEELEELRQEIERLRGALEAERASREKAERRAARNHPLSLLLRPRRGGTAPETAPPASEQPAETEGAERGEPVNLNDASFEQLRRTGMSVTEATRVIAYRERADGFDSVDELEAVPGFRKDSLARLRERLSA